MFCRSRRREIAAHCAALGGLDALVFTAGIGEHSARMRTNICERLGWIGVILDGSANLQHAQRISAAKSQVQVFVVPTEEEIMIAHATRVTWKDLLASSRI